MKRLMGLKVINWHYYTDHTFRFEGATLLTGESGAGKSTVLDALQFGLLGDARLVKFNISAHDQSERSLTTYLRGKTGEKTSEGGTVYVRTKDFTSYIALEFYDNRKHRSFLMGCAIDSYGAGGNDDPVFFKLEGYSLDAPPFYLHPGQLLSARDFRTRVKAVKGDVYTSAQLYRDAVRTKLGHLRPSFFSLLVRGLSFQPVSDFRRFVTDYLLDPKPVDLETMLGNLNSYREFEILAQQAEEKISALQQISDKDSEGQSVEDWICTQDYIILRATTEDAREGLDAMQLGQAETANQAKTARERILQCGQDRTVWRKQEEQLLSDLAGDPNARRDRELNEELTGLSNEITKLKAIGAARQSDVAAEIANLGAAVAEFECTPDYGVGPEAPDLTDLRQSGMIFAPLAAASWVEPVPNTALAKLAEAAERLVEHVANRRHWLKAETQRLEAEDRTLAQELKRLAQGRMTYPEHVGALQELMNQEVGSEASVLCELLNVPDEHWQNAVEGYLDSQRFDLIVPPSDFDSSLAVYERRKRARNLHSVGLVNSGAILAEHPVAVPGSLAEEVQTENPYARAYIDRLLGRVMKCGSEHELKRHRLAITATCMTYRNHTARQMHPDRYATWFVGTRAFARQKEQKETRRTHIRDALSLLGGQEIAAEALQRRLRDRETRYANWAVDWSDLRRLPDLDALAATKQTELGQLDLSRASVLRNEVKSVREELESLQKEENELRELASTLEERRRHEVQETVGQERRLQELEAQLTAFLQQQSNVAEAGADRYLEEHRGGKANAVIVANFSVNRETNRTRATNLRKEVIRLRQDYNKHYAFGAAEDDEENTAYDDEWLKLVESELPSFQTKIADAKKNAEEEFQNHFIFSLWEQIEEARKEFRNLSAVLRDIRFGQDQYSFTVMANPSYKAFYDMLTDPLAIQGATLFSGAFREKHQMTLERFFSGIMHSDPEEQAKNIAVYTDYRTYLDFDLKITRDTGEFTMFSNVLKEQSGGETQTPFYVVIAAAFLQAYRPGNEDSARFMLWDEAFGKMDDLRTENTLRFIRSLGLQLVVAAPIVQAQVIVPYMETNYVFLRDGRHIHVLEYDQVFGDDAAQAEVAAGVMGDEP